MAGMNRHTGKALDGYDHLVQSIGDILSTPKLTRVMRRDYGGQATYLVDKPATEDTLLSFTIALGDAINKWEPRYRLRRVWFEQAGQDGVFLLNVEGIYYPRGHLGDLSTGVQQGIELPLPTGFLVTGLV
jgi:phage baseplate assembly protein W